MKPIGMHSITEHTLTILSVFYLISSKKSLRDIKIPTDSAENKLSQKSMTVLKTGPKFFLFMTAQS